MTCIDRYILVEKMERSLKFSHPPFQIDFYSETIFNIEKGNLKKQFPFSQVKSCEDLEGLRFVIEFHCHPKYELEAASTDDKQKVSRGLPSLDVWVDLLGGIDSVHFSFV